MKNSIGERSELKWTGGRVKLVPLAEAHLEGLIEAGADERIWTYLPLSGATAAGMSDIVEQALAGEQRGEELPWTVVDQASGRILGITRYLGLVPAHRSLEIGWTWYTPAVWRTHVNTECKYMLLRHAFEELGCIRVQLKTDVRNERSNQAIRRIGAQYEGTLRRDRILHDGHIRDANLYSIIEEEWPGVRSHLEQELRRI